MSTLVFDPHARGGMPRRRSSAASRAATTLLGLAAIAARRLNPGDDTSGDGRVAAVAVGLAAAAGDVAGRALAPSRRALGRLGAAAGRLPVVGGMVKAGSRRWAGVVDRARSRGSAILADAQVQAVRTVRSGVDEVTPRVVDLMMPHVVTEVLPRLMPVLMADLSQDPQIRALFMDQSRGAVSDAGRRIHDTAARADDQVESSLRRLLRRRPDAQV